MIAFLKASQALLMAYDYLYCDYEIVVPKLLRYHYLSQVDNKQLLLNAIDTKGVQVRVISLKEQRNLT
jgi:hypothetical protein